MKIEFEPLAVLMREFSIADIANAIKEKGCYGYDEYGEFRLFKDGTTALAMLAYFYKQKIEWQEAKGKEVDLATSDEEFEFLMSEYAMSPSDWLIDSANEFEAWHWGWPIDKIPLRLQRSNTTTQSGIKNNATTSSWQDKCREIADEFEAIDIGHSSIDDMSKRVAQKALALGIKGSHGGLLSAGYIKRNALQGGRWKRKPKPQK